SSDGEAVASRLAHGHPHARDLPAVQVAGKVDDRVHEGVGAQVVVERGTQAQVFGELDRAGGRDRVIGEQRYQRRVRCIAEGRSIGAVASRVLHAGLPRNIEVNVVGVDGHRQRR
nr:hypothetical protein [Tanacetum cinerariifolium]